MWYYVWMILHHSSHTATCQWEYGGNIHDRAAWAWAYMCR